MVLMIRQERIKRAWTQNSVARQIGITKAAFRNIETGARKPSFDVLVKLEDLFGMDYRDLFNLPQRQLREQQNALGGNRESGDLA